MRVCVCVYIYIEREREAGREGALNVIVYINMQTWVELDVIKVWNLIENQSLVQVHMYFNGVIH